MLEPSGIAAQVGSWELGKFDSDISVIKEKEEVNGKSIMGILMLGAEQGAVVCLKATGPDAEKAVSELEKILLAEETGPLGAR